MEYYRGASGASINMVSGLVMLGADAVEVAVGVSHASYLRLGVRCSW